MNPRRQPQRPGQQLPTMTMTERQLWLIAKRAPRNMRLMSLQEIDAMSKQMQRGAVLEELVNATCAVFDQNGYWKNEPDMVNCAGSACFDARRYQEATAHAWKGIQAVRDICQALMPCQEAFAGIDLLKAIELLEAEIVFIADKTNLRRDRTAPVNLEGLPDAPDKPAVDTPPPPESETDQKGSPDT